MHSNPYYATMNLRTASLTLLSAVAINGIALAETVTFNGKQYELEKKIERKIGPGATYTRLRLEHSTSPLNVNLITVDLNNPYNRIETTIANESAKGTESLVKAAARQSSVGHRPLGGANANFWVVATQPEYPLYSGITRNASVRNGKMVTESNQYNEKWDKGTQRTGVTSISYDKTLNIDYCSSTIIAKWNGGSTTIHQCNKGFRVGEICMYNSFFGKTRKFIPYVLGGTDGKTYTEDAANESTEVLLDKVAGSEWTGGKPIQFVVKEIRTNAGHGTLGEHDLALVGRGTSVTTKLGSLKMGDEVTLTYNWTYTGGKTPIVEQAIGGNAQVMRDGVLTEHNSNETYNSQIYSRTGYGCSADGKTLYIIVIDKSTDPVYGKSAGCSTSTMCEIARHFGCSNMQNYDAGGSAEMLIDGAIINKTTEASPRNVANGWLVYSVAPEDKPTITSLAFDHPEIRLAKGDSFTPTILGYDCYDNLRNKNINGFTLSCSPGLGTCSGNTFVAANKDASGTLTATYMGVSVTKNVTIGAGDESMVNEIKASVNIPDNIYVRQPFKVTASTPILKLELIDTEGKVIGYQTPATDECQIEAPPQPGIYLLTISIGNDRLTTKIHVK